MQREIENRGVQYRGIIQEKRMTGEAVYSGRCGVLLIRSNRGNSKQCCAYITSVPDAVTVGRWEVGKSETIGVVPR